MRIYRSPEHLEYPTKSIIFRGFWKDADRTKKFLIDLFSKFEAPGKTIVITSVFPSRSITEKAMTSIHSRMGGKLSIQEIQRIGYGHIEPIKNPNTINIWYSGENSRIPSSTGWDAFLSFENDSTIDKSIFLPFWATRLGDTVSDAANFQKALLNSRAVDTGEGERGRICAVIGNPEPMRLNFIKQLQKTTPVDVFGKITGIYVPDKYSLLRNYTFNICFENDLYPNYVTEKIFESWNAGCIPIWWGIDQAEYLNRSAYINLADSTFAKTIADINEIRQRSELSNKMINSPILQKPFDYSFLINQLAGIISLKF